MSTPISVLHSLAGARLGGAENLYTRLTCALAAEPALQVSACTRPWPERVATLEAAGVEVNTFRFGGRLHWFDHLAYRRHLKRSAPQVVTTFMNRATALTPSGDYTLVARLGHYYNLKNYRHCDYWIGISRGICDHLIRGGMPAERVVHIPNFADESPLEPIPRDSFGTPTDRPLLLAAGRLHRNKAFDILLQALTRVPDAVLWLAGEGPEEEALRTQCSQLGLTERVRFLGWRRDVGALMRSADLFVCPSRHEGLGSIVVESWLHGCPILATRSQGPGELIEHGSNGLLTPVDDADALADGICQLLAEPALAQALAEQAQRDYQAHYSRRVITDQYTEFYRRLAKR